MIRILQLLIVVVASNTLVAAGCAGSHHKDSGSLSESEALELALTLANGECTKKFSQAPFNESSSAVEFRDGLVSHQNIRRSKRSRRI